MLRSRLYLITTSHLLILWAGHTHAMITLAQAVTLPDGKRVTLLADRHGQTKESTKQLDAFTTELQNYSSKKTTKPLRLLIERVSQLYYKLSRDKSVLSHLPLNLQESPIEKVAPEIMGFPQEVLTGIYLLRAKDMQTIDKLCSVDDTIKTLDFNRLLSVFDTEVKRIGTECSAITHDTLQKHLARAASYKATILKFLTDKHISIDTPLTEYKKSYTSSNDSILSGNFMDGFSHLLESEYVCKILSAQEKNIAVLAGYKHTNAIYSLLLDAGARHAYSTGSITADAQGLTQQQLAQILGDQRNYKKMAGFCCVSVSCMAFSCLLTLAAIQQIIATYSPL